MLQRELGLVQFEQMMSSLTCSGERNHSLQATCHRGEHALRKALHTHRRLLGSLGLNFWRKGNRHGVILHVILHLGAS